VELLKYPNPLLREPTVEVVSFGEEIARSAEGMLEVMYRYKGIGLAGPQAGLCERIVVINPSGKQADELTLVNPQVVDFSGEVKYEEGCLSFPGIYAKIERPEHIRCVARTLDGKEICLECGGLLARVVLHEVDHLKGVLLVDRMSPAERKVHQRDLRRLRKEHKG
jgi:peptide deformylase